VPNGGSRSGATSAPTGGSRRALGIQHGRRLLELSLRSSSTLSLSPLQARMQGRGSRHVGPVPRWPIAGVLEAS
jgi:hypothetical protein